MKSLSPFFCSLSLCFGLYFSFASTTSLALAPNPTEALFAGTIDWKKDTVKEGIEIYRAPNVDHHSGLVPLRLVMTIPHNILKIASFMDRTDLKHEWIPKLQEAKVVQQTSMYEKIEYAHYAAPWPFRDRDFLINIKSQVDLKNKRIFVTLVSDETADYPQEKGRVRGFTKGAVTIKALDENHTEIEMILVSDLKGTVPKWLMGIIQDQWPVGFVSGLKKKLDSSEVTINPNFAKLMEVSQNSHGQHSNNRQ
jgi:hypothetical protein